MATIHKNPTPDPGREGWLLAQDFLPPESPQAEICKPQEFYTLYQPLSAGSIVQKENQSSSFPDDPPRSNAPPDVLAYRVEGVKVGSRRKERDDRIEICPAVGAPATIDVPRIREAFKTELTPDVPKEWPTHDQPEAALCETFDVDNIITEKGASDPNTEGMVILPGGAVLAVKPYKPRRSQNLLGESMEPIYPNDLFVVLAVVEDEWVAALEFYEAVKRIKLWEHPNDYANIIGHCPLHWIPVNVITVFPEVELNSRPFTEFRPNIERRNEEIPLKISRNLRRAPLDQCWLSKMNESFDPRLMNDVRQCENSMRKFSELLRLTDYWVYPASSHSRGITETIIAVDCGTQTGKFVHETIQIMEPDGSGAEFSFAKTDETHNKDGFRKERSKGSVFRRFRDHMKTRHEKPSTVKDSNDFKIASSHNWKRNIDESESGRSECFHARTPEPRASATFSSESSSIQIPNLGNQGEVGIAKKRHSLRYLFSAIKPISVRYSLRSTLRRSKRRSISNEASRSFLAQRQQLRMEGINRNDGCTCRCRCGRTGVDVDHNTYLATAKDLKSLAETLKMKEKELKKEHIQGIDGWERPEVEQGCRYDNLVGVGGAGCLQESMDASKSNLCQWRGANNGREQEQTRTKIENATMQDGRLELAIEPTVGYGNQSENHPSGSEQALSPRASNKDSWSDFSVSPYCESNDPHSQVAQINPTFLAPEHILQDRSLSAASKASRGSIVKLFHEHVGSPWLQTPSPLPLSSPFQRFTDALLRNREEDSFSVTTTDALRVRLQEGGNGARGSGDASRVEMNRLAGPARGGFSQEMAQNMEGPAVIKTPGLPDHDGRADGTESIGFYIHKGFFEPAVEINRAIVEVERRGRKKRKGKKCKGGQVGPGNGVEREGEKEDEDDVDVDIGTCAGDTLGPNRGGYGYKRVPSWLVCTYGGNLIF